jgi:hypothetical protein
MRKDTRYSPSQPKREAGYKKSQRRDFREPGRR